MKLICDEIIRILSHIDGWIISTNAGNYIVSIFISNFNDHYFYANNPASLLGANINKILFETFEQNRGSIK